MDQRLKVLFVCSRNRWRSPTAEQIYRDSKAIMVRSGGTSPNARRRVTFRDLEWADLVLVMEKRHRDILRSEFASSMKSVRLEVLNIPDEYQYMDSELVDEIRACVERLVPEVRSEAESPKFP